MKSKIKQVFNMFERLFSGQYDPFQFSNDMEQYLYDNYEEMLAENKEVTLFLNDEVPDICSEGEPGFDATNMITKLKKIYNQAVNTKKLKARHD